MLSIRTTPDPTAPIDPQLERLVREVAAAFNSVRKHLGLEQLERIDVLVSSDFKTTVRAHSGYVVDGEVLADFDDERLAGNVAAKVLNSDSADPHPIVILNESFFQSSTPQQLDGSILLISHEFAHTLISQLRSNYGNSREFLSVPWDVAKIVTLNAFDEYWADFISDLVAPQFGRIIENNGVERPLSRSSFR